MSLVAASVIATLHPGVRDKELPDQEDCVPDTPKTDTLCVSPVVGGGFTNHLEIAGRRICI